MCSIQVAFCSQKDQFNKKIGRQTVETKEAIVIQKRMLPHQLLQYCKKVTNTGWWGESDFHYLYKYLF